MSAQAIIPTTAAADEFGVPASAERVLQVRDALRANGFFAEVDESVEQARRRLRALLPIGGTVLTAASETLRISGIEEDINDSPAFDSIRARVHRLNREKDGDAIRRLRAAPDVVVGSVSAVTESGVLVAVSASGSQLAAYAGGARELILVVGAQKIVADLATAFRRVQEYAGPLETERTKRVYGVASSANRILILNRDPFIGRTTVILVNEPIGF